MSQVEVHLGQHSYLIDIAKGNIGCLGSLLQNRRFSSKALIISDEQVGALYGTAALASVTGAGFEAALCCVKAGEASKSLANAEVLYTKAIELGLDRNSPIIALGGGVVGDLAGFVAATYLRGIPFIQVPTSLLAQVDSSVGGKVAVDHHLGKNLIGAFYQPKFVLIDTGVLHTLPMREWLAGLGEVLKYGVIASQELFAYLQQQAAGILAHDQDMLGHIITKSCEIKAKIVEEDEHEANVRMLLNFGHTIGHAVEANAGYEGYKHGEAVAIGMHGAALISRYLGLCNQHTVDELRQVIDSFALPLFAPEAKTEDLLPYLWRDKKYVNGRMNWVLVEAIGRCRISADVPLDIVTKAVNEITKRK